MAELNSFAHISAQILINGGIGKEKLSQFKKRIVQYVVKNIPGI